MDKNEPRYEDGSSMREGPQSQRECYLIEEAKNASISSGFRLGFIFAAFLLFTPYFILGVALGG
jgi:hypothetical protein